MGEILFLIIPNDIIQEGKAKKKSEKLSDTELFFKIEIGAIKFAFGCCYFLIELKGMD